MLLQAKNGNLLNSKDDNDKSMTMTSTTLHSGIIFLLGRKLPVITLEPPKLQIFPHVFLHAPHDGYIRNYI